MNVLHGTCIKTFLEKQGVEVIAIGYFRTQSQKRLEQGHPWVYAGEVASVEGNPEAGGLVDVLNHQGRFLAVGYYNPASQIRVRIVSQGPLAIMDTAFLQNGLRIVSNTEIGSFRVRMLIA